MKKGSFATIMGMFTMTKGFFATIMVMLTVRKGLLMTIMGMFGVNNGHVVAEAGSTARKLTIWEHYALLIAARGQ